MRFIVSCIDPKVPGKPRTFEYESDNCSVFDTSGNRIEFQNTPAFSKVPAPKVNSAITFSKGKPILGKSKHPAKINVQLGLACNYDCAYCLQGRSRALATKSPRRGDVAHFFELMQGAGISPSEHGFVDIWGGEPLVYWEATQELIRIVRQKWPESITISMFTNGVLLDREKIDFLTDNKVCVTISHDGPGQKLRSPEDPLVNTRIAKNWRYLIAKNIESNLPSAFFSVLTPRNCNLKELRTFFNRFDPSVGVSFGGVASETEVLPQDCIFTDSDSERMALSFFEEMLEDSNRWPGLKRKVANLMTRFIHHVDTSAIRSHCISSDDQVLSVDIWGNVLSCQNRPADGFRIGTLKDFDSIRNAMFTHWTLRENCKRCPVLPSCKGGCPDLSNMGFDRCCTNEFAYNAAIFRLAWWYLTGTILVTLKEAKQCITER